MTTKAGVFLALTLAFLWAGPAVAEKGQIFGRIHTDRGDVLEGAIRWDKNEASWDDVFDGNKALDEDDRKHGRRKYRDDNTNLVIFGVSLFDSQGWSSMAQSGLAFGHIKELHNEGDDEVELVLKSGEKVEFFSGSTDFGDGIREIIIETADEGELELDWDDIDYIEFADGGDVKSSFGHRLYGTVTTSRAGEYTGWICWDVDEMFDQDIIDGSERGRKRKIKFADIARIERVSSRASNVVTRDGQKMRLDDSNDIDSGNRGIVISDRRLGRIVVEWDEFESLDLKEPPADAWPGYTDFDGGRQLYGTVYDESGDQYSGYVRWDEDEIYTWEMLDGNYRGVEFDIFFEHIKVIEKLSDRSSLVTLQDGRQFRLRGSNDVNDENKGISVADAPEDAKDATYLEWEEFDRVEFRSR